MPEPWERSRVSAIAVCCSTGVDGILELVERFRAEAVGFPALTPVDDLAIEVAAIVDLLGADESDRDCVVGIRISGAPVDLVAELADLEEELLWMLFLDTLSGLRVIPVDRPRFGATDPRGGCEPERLDTELEALRLGADELTLGGGVVGRVRE